MSREVLEKLTDRELARAVRCFELNDFIGRDLYDPSFYDRDYAIEFLSEFDEDDLQVVESKAFRRIICNGEVICSELILKL